MNTFNFQRFQNVARWDIAINRSFYTRMFILVAAIALLPMLMKYLFALWTIIALGGSREAYITMNAAGDHLFVNGSATFVSSLSDNGQYVLSAGKMELKGSVSFGAAFRADKNHLIVLSGDEMQMVSQNSNSMLGTVRLENSSEAGVVLFTEFHAESLVKNGCRISMYNQEGIVGESLTDDEEIGGALILDAGTLDLCGFTLTVHGDVILNGGTIKFSGGSLVVDGDFRVQKRYVYKSGKEHTEYTPYEPAKWSRGSSVDWLASQVNIVPNDKQFGGKNEIASLPEIDATEENAAFFVKMVTFIDKANEMFGQLNDPEYVLALLAANKPLQLDI